MRGGVQDLTLGELLLALYGQTQIGLPWDSARAIAREIMVPGERIPSLLDDLLAEYDRHARDRQ